MNFLIKIRQSKLWRWGLLTILAGSSCGLIYGVSVPALYDSSAVLLPEGSNTFVSVSNLRRMSAIVGRSLDYTSDAVKPLFYDDVVLSTPFLEEILNTRVSTLDGKVDTTLRVYLTDYQKTPWWNTITGLPNRIKKSFKGTQKETVPGADEQICLSEDELELINGLSACIVADVAYMTRRMIIRVRMQDPQVAYQTASAIISNLETYINDYRSGKNENNFEYIEEVCRQEKQRLVEQWMEYACAVDNNADISNSYGKMDIEQKKEQMELDLKIYSQIYIQSKIAGMNIDMSVPVMRIIQPPMVVMKKADPRIWLCMLRFSLLFLFAGIVFYIIRRPWE